MIPRTLFEMRRETAWVDAAVATIAEQAAAPVDRVHVLSGLLDDVHVSQRRRRLKVLAQALLRREPVGLFHAWSVDALREAERYPGRAAPGLLEQAVAYVLANHPAGMDAASLGELLLEDPIAVESACRDLARRGELDSMGPRWFAVGARPARRYAVGSA